MAGTDPDDETEKPLDPAAERLRRKMVRLLAVSIGTMLVAIMAVLGAVVYKIGRDRPPRAAAVADAIPIDLPVDATVEHVAMADGEALLHVREGDRQGLLRIDLATGSVTGRYDFRRP